MIEDISKDTIEEEVKPVKNKCYKIKVKHNPSIKYYHKYIK